MNVLKNDRYALGQNIKATIAIAESNNKDTAEAKEETKEVKPHIPTLSDVDKALAKELSDPRIGGFTGNILASDRKAISHSSIVGRFMAVKIVPRPPKDGKPVRSKDNTRDLKVAVVTIEQSDGTTIKCLTDSKYFAGLGLFTPNQLISAKLQHVIKGDRFDLGSGNVSTAKSDSIKLDDLTPASIMSYYNAVGAHIATLDPVEKSIAMMNMQIAMKAEFQMQAMISSNTDSIITDVEDLGIE